MLNLMNTLYQVKEITSLNDDNREIQGPVLSIFYRHLKNDEIPLFKYF